MVFRKGHTPWHKGVAWKTSKPNTVCAQCGKLFYAYPWEIKRGRKYCSRECMGNAYKGRKNTWSVKEKIPVICPCGKTFFLTPGQVRPRRGKYCSRECYYKFRVPVTGTPKGSKRPPFSREWRRKLSEAAKKRVGEKNSHWQGGKTPLQFSIRNSELYKQWRKRVFERDNYACIMCGTAGNGKNLNADHIVPLSVLIRNAGIKSVAEAINTKELWDVENGRTLCISCHRETDTYGWKVWNYFLRPGKLNKGG